MFEREFLEQLPDDVTKAGVAVCGTIIERITRQLRENENRIFDEYYEYVKGFDVVRALADIASVNLPDPKLNAGVNVRGRINDVQAIRNVCREAIELFGQRGVAEQANSVRSIFQAKFGVGFYYEFTSGDLDRVQLLINELRESISSSDRFEEEHKQRLLRRLERLQGELHKRVPDLDRFWGLVGDAGIVLGKLGESAKPIVDRVREITEIVWRTQARKEELPSGARPALLESKDRGP